MTTALTTLVIAELVVLVLLSLLVLGLLRSHALILKSLHELGAGLELDRQVEQEEGSGPGPVPVELERGVVAPIRTSDEIMSILSGQDLGGTPQVVDLAQGRTLLAFLTTGCSVCAGFWEEFREPVAVPGGGELVVVAKGDEESPSALAKVTSPGLPLLRSDVAWGDLEVPGSPYFVYVDSGRIIGEGSATSWAQVSDLMAQAVADDEHRASQADGFVDRGGRDDPGSVDDELLAAGIGPDNPSLHRAAPR